jgi:uncharacterized membrane protein
MTTSATTGSPLQSTYTRAASGPARPASSRIASLDVVRGVVMILMAIDHVRVYSGVPAGGPSPGVFFTRWITNFVAPAFAFLAGTGAFLYGRRVNDRRALAKYLATRGILLVLLELTFLRFAWTFNFDYAHYVLAGVIWMLGWCMLMMAGLVWLPTAVIGAFGVVMIAGHDILDRSLSTLVPALQHSSSAWLWQLLYFGGPIQFGDNGTTLMVLYSLVPWIGVMAAGYALGQVMLMEPERRHRICYALGVGAIALFLLLRGFDVYGDPRPWATAAQSRLPAPFRFLNTNKYPASFLFLLMTLGPMFVSIPLAERARGRIGDVLSTFGRVPLFYYLLHIPAIHLAAVIVSSIREGTVNPWLFGNHPSFIGPAPHGYMWSLTLLYAVFAVVVAALYLPCKWYARTKARHRDSLLRYL